MAPLTQDEDDAAVVIAILHALSAAGEQPKPPAPRDFWSHRPSTIAPQTPGAWWASGLPR